jgi:two-component system sensor histidine kinase ChvG
MKADVDKAKQKSLRFGVLASVMAPLRKAGRYIQRQSFSSITRRIVLLNLAGLIALVSGILYLSEYRAGLIDARIQSLLTQGEIIAGAIASSATADNNSLTVDPEKLLELQAGQSYSPEEESAAGLEFPINPERVAPLLRRLVTPTKTRARIYDRDGTLLLDSSTLYLRGEILRFDLEPVPNERPNYFERRWRKLKLWLARGDLPIYRELGPGNGKGYPEVAQAINGQDGSVVGVTEQGQVIVTVAVPIQRFRAISGALLLSTQPGEIDNAVESERFVIVKVFFIAATVMIILSFLLAGAIGGPLRRLASAAQNVRRRTRARVEIPDMTYRTDEIGYLSGSIREMTDALYARIEGIESFAADVAHELKNPLTSLRSAVETLPLAKTEESRARLMSVIQHDVRRLDRLITDISEASRLDAEMQRQESAPVDMAKLLAAITTLANEVPRDDQFSVSISF